MNICITAKKDLHEVRILHGGLTQSKVLVKKMIHLRIHYNHDNKMMTIKIYMSHQSRPASMMQSKIYIVGHDKILHHCVVIKNVENIIGHPL